MNAQFKKGALEICVLSQLAQGDKYGYELTERISEEMSIASGTLYQGRRICHHISCGIRIWTSQKILQTYRKRLQIPGRAA